MTIQEFITALVAAALIMSVLDFLWLGFIAKKLYYGEMGDILLKKPNMFAAVLFYIVYIVGAVVLVIEPNWEMGNLNQVIMHGALLGFVAYATYDLTNLATLKGFSKKVVVIDLIWGTIITTAVCAGSFLAADWLV